MQKGYIYSVTTRIGAKKYKSNSNSTENMGPCLKLISTKYVTVKRVKREAYCHNGAKKLHRVASKFSRLCEFF